MRRRIVRMLQYLNGALILLAVITGVTRVSMIFGFDRVRSFLTGLSILIPYVVSLIAVKRCRSIFTYLLFSLISIIPVFLLSYNILDRIVFLLISVIVIIIRTVGRLHETEDALSMPHIALVSIFVIFYVLSLYTGDDLMKYVNYYAAFGYTILVLVFMNLTRLESYLIVHQNISNVPVHRISRTNAGVLSLFLIVTVIVMIVLPLTGFENFLRNLGHSLMELLRRMLANRQIADETTTIEEVVTDTAPSGGGMPDFGPTNEAPPWLKALYKALSVAVIAASVGLILYLVVRLIIHIVRQFYRPFRENSDEEEFIGPDDEKESLITRSSALPSFLDFSPNAQARRQFRRTVQKKKKVDSKAYTPNELLDYAEVPQGEFRTVLHELYEKARYSRDGVTKEDVKRLKS